MPKSAPARNAAMTLLPVCQTISLGRVEYRRAWELQTELVAAVHDGKRPSTLLLLEHPHVYTRGRLAPSDHIRLNAAQLEAQGIKVVETDRGGLVTYHGPGQLVAYPVVNLRGWGGPLQYIRALEQIIIGVLADFGIAAGVEAGMTGVWVEETKIAAIGVKISRGVAHHGFAINVNPDLTRFDHIIPCGLADRAVTSMAQILGRENTAGIEMARVQRSVGNHFGQGMGYRMVDGGGMVDGGER